MDQITIKAPDDWHLHFRDGVLLPETVSATARCFKRAIVMPNLIPPVTKREQALAYRERILEAAGPGSDFNPLMTLYLTDETTPEQIKEAASKIIPAAKLYPAGATTNSEGAVGSIEKLFPVFEAMSECGMLLLVHGEVADDNVDIFDREKEFIDQHLAPIHVCFPNLKIVFEHITTSEAVDFVLQTGDNTAATVTPQHLMMNRNDLLSGGIRPHNYCLPVLKRNVHQQRLREAVASGSHKFFLGTDSAPHTKQAKENPCGCAGCYSAWGAMELYAQIFDELGAMAKLEGFASIYGPMFYGLPVNRETVTLIRDSWTMPDIIELPSGESIVPFYAGQQINWRLEL
ncbi:MAG: dihydroorotase [Gammaproteobacteria bacterium]|nr:dihydroorotase [Gammaproteobacteria bacterium]